MDTKPKGPKLGDLIQSITRRSPSKRQIKPVNTDNLVLDELEDESDDEYVYDGHDDGGSVGTGESSGEEDESVSDSDSGESDDSENSVKIVSMSCASDAIQNDSVPNTALSLPSEAYPASFVTKNISLNSSKLNVLSDVTSGRICMLCLGDQSHLNDELIECDACHVVVHEDCYKVYDEVFLSSSASSSDTDPWFCEPCLAGVENTLCELCPNMGGVFKRTDNNRWVHLLCALYTPGVAFNYSENLSEVTLTELSAKEWSSKECTLCAEKFFAWTGVCINCDAGLCKNYFHVTCAQKEGLLAEPAYEENPTDPYFAQCRQHTDKQVAKARRRNYLSAHNRCNLLRQLAEKKSPKDVDAYAFDDIEHSTLQSGGRKSKFALLDDRLKGKLEHFRRSYETMLSKREVPYTRPNKVALYLENSPGAMRMFMTKAMALSLPIELTGSSAVTEASKSAAPGCPIFCPDFVSYVLDREKKIEEYSKKKASLEAAHTQFQTSEAKFSHSYNILSNRLTEVKARRTSNRDKATKIVGLLSKMAPGFAASNDLNRLLAPSETAAEADATNTSSDKCVVLDTSGAAIDHSTPAAIPSRGGIARIHIAALIGASRKRSLKQAASTAPAVKKVRRTGEHRTGAAASRNESSGDIINISEESVIQGEESGGAGSSVVPVETIFHQCNVCQGFRDQHLLVVCDTCKKAFHIACLDPPLSRVPKRSKVFAWQCSMCTLAIVTPCESVSVDVNAPRQLRRSAAPLAPTTTPVPRQKAIPASSTNNTSSSTATRSRGVRASTGGLRGRRRPRRVEAEEYPMTTTTAPVVTPPRGDVVVLPAEAYPAVAVDESSRGTSIAGPSSRREPIVIDDENDDEDSVSDSSSEEGASESDPLSTKNAGSTSKQSTRGSDDELASLRGSKVKFVRIKGHESPNESFDESKTQRYVICQLSRNAPKESPSPTNFKITIRKSNDSQ